MKKHICSILFAFLIPLLTIGQNTSKNILVDNLGNVYVINKDKILKYESDGKLNATFSYKNSGEISSVDITDPLKIVVFYKNFGQLIFLDNTLSITKGPISLFDYNIINPVLVCATSDKGLWVYDRQNFTIFKFDDNLKLISTIPNIPILIDSEFEPVFMLGINSFLYLTYPKKGVFVLDQYGSLYKKIHFKDINSFDIMDNAIVYNDKGIFKKIDLLTYAEQVMNVTDKVFLSQTFKDNYIYLLNADGTSYTKMKPAFSKE